MLATFPVPILSITTEAVKDLQGPDALYSLWTVFTKCKESVQDGRRLENISWRLWYREQVQAQVSYQPPTSELATPHSKDERCHSYFPQADMKVSPKLHAVSSGLSSPSDQASPSPLPPPIASMVPLSTPGRPQISPHSPGSAVPLSLFTRSKLMHHIGRQIVDMLPNQLVIPQPRPTPAATAKAVLSTPLPTAQLPRSCDPNLLLVQQPTNVETPLPRVVVANPMPPPTPPTTLILHDDIPGAPQLPSIFLLSPLPAPVLRPIIPSTEVDAQQQSQPPHLLIPKGPLSSHASIRIADTGPLARQPASKKSPSQAQPSVIPRGFSGHIAAGNVVRNGNANANGSAKPNPTRNVNGNANANTQSWKTIIVANTSSGEDSDEWSSDEWSSEEADAEDKAREAETRLRKVVLEAQRQRELFAKVPKSSYSGFKHSQLGLLSQRMSPNHVVPPLSRPYQNNRSSGDMIAYRYQYPQRRAEGTRVMFDKRRTYSRPSGRSLGLSPATLSNPEVTPAFGQHHNR